MEKLFYGSWVKKKTTMARFLKIESKSSITSQLEELPILLMLPLAANPSKEKTNIIGFYLLTGKEEPEKATKEK